MNTNEKYRFVCRVCLVKDSSEVMHSLVDQPTRKLLFKCTTLWVTPGDKYPQQLCTKCWNKCTNWSVFQALARDSDRRLRLGKEDDEKKARDDLDVDIVDEDEEDDDKVEEEQDDEEEEIIMVEDDEDYLEGYSLAPEEVEEEEDGESELELSEPSDSDAETQQNEEVKTTGRGNSITRRRKCKYCSKLLSCPSQLQVHERIHTDERPFPCGECDKKFRSNSALTKHKLNHSGIKPFKCDQCSHRSTLKCNLIKHKQTHSNEVPFKCNVCGNRFKYKSSLTAHLKEKHKQSTINSLYSPYI